jgi:uncharacterized DUF497 family protein
VRALRFEWDPKKAAANLRRHEVAFEEASTAFYDENAILIDDPDHSANEERFVLLGLSASARLLVVPHCYRAGSDVIRLISAWKGDRRDRATYFGRFAK